MNADQKVKIAKSIIHCSFALIVVMLFMAILMFHNPSSMKTSIKIFQTQIEFDCDFYGTGDENSK